MALPKKQVPALAPAAEPRTALTPSDDAYHFRFYRGRPHLFMYTEWWYYAFTDTASGWSGITALAIFNPENTGGLGRCGLTAALFPPDGRQPIVKMDYLKVDAFSASYENADVTLGGSSVRVASDGSYRLKAQSEDGDVALDLLYRPEDEPRLMADEVVGYEPWEVASWLVYMPSARVHGTLNVGPQLINVSNAAGYHDHNWGMWEVTKRTWAWAQFTSPDKQLAFALGQHAAFWYSTAYLRLGELRLQFPGELIQYEPVSWSRWMGLWRYPNRVKLTAHDSTGLYKLELTWDAPDTAALWKSPVPLFEQRAEFTGALYQKQPGGSWREVTPIKEHGLAEFTATWL